MSLIKRKLIQQTEHERILLMQKKYAEGKAPANLPQSFFVLKNHLDGFCTYLESFGYPHHESLRQRCSLHQFDRWLEENKIQEFIPEKTEEYLSQIPKSKYGAYKRALYFYTSFLENVPLAPRKSNQVSSKKKNRKYKKWISEHQKCIGRKPLHVLESETVIICKYLSRNKYSDSTIAQTITYVRKLDKFLLERNLEKYSPELYLKIENEFLKTVSEKVRTKNAIKLLNNAILHKPLIVTKVKKQPEPVAKPLEISLTKYGQACLKAGNKPATVSKKIKLSREFLRNCSISELKEITPEIIQHAISITRNKEEWNYARYFLDFCFNTKLIEKKYGELIPKYSAPKKLPSTYSVEEITTIEFSINRKTSIGKRDYALLLLATRMGLRSGDIVGMKFEYLDFDQNKIRLFQEKTGNYIELELLEIVKEALTDYIENARPHNKNPYIFLSCKGPYKQISTGTLRSGVVKKYMSIAKISTTGKKHGPHALRASLATSMVNDDIPFEAVSKILGHSSKETIKRYAKLDIEHLRACAIEVTPPTGSFKFWLDGGLNEL